MEGNLRFKIDWASLQREGNLPFLLCFTLYSRANSNYKPSGGLIFGGAIQPRVFCVTGLGSLYLEGLIHGEAYFRNFTVYQHSLYRASPLPSLNQRHLIFVTVAGFVHGNPKFKSSTTIVKQPTGSPPTSWNSKPEYMTFI